MWHRVDVVPHRHGRAGQGRDATGRLSSAPARTGSPTTTSPSGACKGTCTKAYPNELWLQRSDHTFVDAATASGVADEHGRGREPMVLDNDKDGRLDLFVGGNEESQVYFGANRLYRNAGGRFVEMTGTPVTAEVGSSCSTSGDIDGDGWTDILNCGTARINAYRNVGGTSFTDVSTSIGLPTSIPKDLELGDVDGDGRPDLLVVRGSRVELRLNRAGTFSTVDYTLTINAGRNAASPTRTATDAWTCTSSRGRTRPILGSHPEPGLHSPSPA